jgi:AcrR family transcriptional regulator
LSVTDASIADHRINLRILRAAANLICEKHYMALTLEEVACSARMPVRSVQAVFPNMHAAGAAILNHERETMLTAQARVHALGADPLDRIRLAFRSIGEVLANDVIVRAGTNIAAEARYAFPERRLDPSRTWEQFVSAELEQALAQRLVAHPLNAQATATLIVAAGLGTRDVLAIDNAWGDAPGRFESMIESILSLISVTKK